MRRALAIALMCVLGLPLFVSLLGQTGNQALPICCRRAGAHRCAEMASTGSMAGEAAAKSSLRMACPAYPRPEAAAHTGVWSFGAERAGSPGGLQQPTIAAQVAAGYRIACGRARQKRGPPASNSERVGTFAFAAFAG